MIRYSIETLWHFGCGICGKWWSIGDHQMTKPSDGLTCPHCGVKQAVREAKEVHR
jgi:DNA-directed RNA polymerase subunit RPC12/RpoP